MNSFIDSSAFCLGPPKRVPSDSEKHLSVYTYHPAQCHATCGVLTRLPAKLAKKNGMRVKTSADSRLKKKLRVYTASDANWLKTSPMLSKLLHKSLKNRVVNAFPMGFSRSLEPAHPKWVWFILGLRHTYQQNTAGLSMDVYGPGHSL